MKKIKIFINKQEFQGSLNNTKTAENIYKILPIETSGNLWGKEIYFEIPLKMSNEKPTETLKIGDLAYWPEGNCFCLFFGKTPASINDNPRPASPVTVIGNFFGDFTKLNNLKKVVVKILK